MIRTPIVALLLLYWVAGVSHAGSIAPIDEDMAALGRALFEDVRLSRDGSLSCASCHDLDYAGADVRGTSIGIHKKPLRRNAPSVYNE